MTFEERKKKIEAYPDNTMFFIQSYGFVGNSLNLWADGASSYTTDPTKAGQFNKEFVLKQLSCNRACDSFWPVSELMEKKTFHVDMQKVDPKLKI